MAGLRDRLDRIERLQAELAAELAELRTEVAALLPAVCGGPPSIKALAASRAGCG
jgi:hypothetical protein